MTEPIALAIDQGTHATRAMLLDTRGRIRFASLVEIGLHRRGDQHVEQDPEEILVSVQKTLQDALGRAKAVGDIVCAGLATQRSSVVTWDRRSGRALSPVISWQDRRASQWIQRFDHHGEKIKEHTGLPLSPHYGAGKLRWLMDYNPAVKNAHDNDFLAWGPLASFLLYHLLDKPSHVVDHANAQRTQLWNLGTQQWDPWLMRLFDIPEDSLPACRPVCHGYGHLKVADIPMMAVTGDQSAAYFSLGTPHPHTAVVNLGTGAFILAATGNTLCRHPGLLSGLVSSTDRRCDYVVEGTVNGAGAALSWAAETWQMPDLFRRLPEWLDPCEMPPLFINTVGGLGSPWWRPDISPYFVGDGTRRQKALAVVESILFLLQRNMDAMAESGLTISRLNVTGGLARLDGLCQRMADLSQKPVYRPSDTEATARGIAWLAFQCPRRWPKPGRGRVFQPKTNSSLGSRYKRFCRILAEEVF